MTNAPLSLGKGKFLPILMPNGGDWQVMILVVKMSELDAASSGSSIDVSTLSMWMNSK